MTTKRKEKIQSPWELQGADRAAAKVGERHRAKIDDQAAERWAARFSGPRFEERFADGGYRTLLTSQFANRVALSRQYEFYAQQGDVARRLDFGPRLVQAGGWARRTIIAQGTAYQQNTFVMRYPGPGFYPVTARYPRWSAWLDWSWGWRTPAIYDPRPVIARPYVYDVARDWRYFDMPRWQALPVIASGTWVDVEPAAAERGSDLQLLAVRFVDPGHPEQEIGPRYRVWFRNNTTREINQPFDVIALADTDGAWQEGLPFSGIRVDGIEAGETRAIDIRLPAEANTLAQSRDGQTAPFSTLHVMVDSNRELDEFAENNNGASIERDQILPVDPAAFAVDIPHAEPGAVVTLAGEGFGPEPGQVVLVNGDREQPLEVVGWYDLGVQVRLPNASTSAEASPELIVVRGDGAASNPLSILISEEGGTGS